MALGAQIPGSIARMIRPLLMCLRLSRGVCQHNLQPRHCTAECHSEPRRAVRGLVSQTFWGIIEFAPTMSKKAWSSADMMGDEVLKLRWGAMLCGVRRRSLSFEVGNPGSSNHHVAASKSRNQRCMSTTTTPLFSLDIVFSFESSAPWNYRPLNQFNRLHPDVLHIYPRESALCVEGRDPLFMYFSGQGHCNIVPRRKTLLTSYLSFSFLLQIQYILLHSQCLPLRYPCSRF